MSQTPDIESHHPPVTDRRITAEWTSYQVTDIAPSPLRSSRRPQRLSRRDARPPRHAFRQEAFLLLFSLSRRLLRQSEIFFGASAISFSLHFHHAATPIFRRWRYWFRRRDFSQSYDIEAAGIAHRRFRAAGWSFSSSTVSSSILRWWALAISGRDTDAAAAFAASMVFSGVAAVLDISLQHEIISRAERRGSWRIIVIFSSISLISFSQLSADLGFFVRSLIFRYYHWVFITD